MIFDAVTACSDRLYSLAGNAACGFVRGSDGMPHQDFVAYKRSLSPAKVDADCDRASTS